MKVDYMKKPSWKRLKVNDNTKRTLKNGKVIPTWSAMVRKASKIK